MEKNVGTGLPDSPTAKRHKKRRTVGDAGPYQEEERHKRTVGDAGPCKDVPHFRFPVIPTKAQPRGGIRSLLLGKRILRLRYAPLRMTKRWNRVPFSVSLRGRRPHPRVASLAPLGQFTSWQSPGRGLPCCLKPEKCRKTIAGDSHGPDGPRNDIGGRCPPQCACNSIN